jgi:hypothetical protein
MVRDKAISIRRCGQVAFDTNEFVKNLCKGGLNTEAASTLCSLMNPAISTAIKKVTDTSVKKTDFERELSSYNVELQKLKNELTLRQTETFRLGKHATEQLLRDLRTNRQRFHETLGTIRSEMRLEVNLERGKQRDAALETALAFQDLKTRVDAEAGNAYAVLAKLRHDIFYSLTGFLFTSIAALFGFLRLASL